MLDSLVRVTRRANENHFVSIANTHVMSPSQYLPSATLVLCTPAGINEQDLGHPARGACYQYLNPSDGSVRKL